MRALVAYGGGGVQQAVYGAYLNETVDKRSQYASPSHVHAAPPQYIPTRHLLTALIITEWMTHQHPHPYLRCSQQGQLACA